MANDIKWLKLMNDMFEDDKIEYIESLPDGDSVLVIWVKVLCLASKCNNNGYLMVTSEIPYTPPLLANKFKKPATQVDYALLVMQKLGMIDIMDDIIQVSNWCKYQSVDELARIREQNRLRVAKHRELRRLEQQVEVCQYCGGKATGYDHIIAISKGGADNDENKVPCCIECNHIKNDKPLVDFLNSNRERINDKIVLSNPKLSRLVTLCNVTNHYIVTQNCNDFALISNSNSNSNSNYDILDYKKLLEIVKEECYSVYLRHSKQVDERGNLQLVRQVTALLEDLQGQYTYEQLREIFRHANKTYIVSPQYSTLDIAWVLKNISKVMQTEESDMPRVEEDTTDKPKGHWDDALDKIGRLD